MPLSEFLLQGQNGSDGAAPGGIRSKLENAIVVADCLSVLESLPDNCIDLVHTSPPYNIDKQYAASLPDRSELSEYDCFLRQVISEIKRVLRPGGSIFWQTGYTKPNSKWDGDILPIDIATYEHFRARPVEMILWDRIIWRYWGGHAFKRKLTNKHETILWYVKPGQEPTFLLDAIRERAKEYDKRNNFWGRNPGNVWEVDRVAYGSTEQTSHIAVFPEELSERIIRACSNPGDLVMDPFCGSGTVPKVARSLGRNWLGIEISPIYAEESARRIGYQQPSEAESLISGLIKHLSFSNKLGEQQLSSLTKTLRLWACGVDMAKLTEEFNRDVADALADTRASGAMKRAAWAKYDDMVSSPLSQNPVLLADKLLLRCYKNRQNLNGVSRFRTAQEALGEVVASLAKSDAEVAELVAKIANQEPSSYLVNGDSVMLQSVDRKIAQESSIARTSETTDESGQPPLL